MKKTISLILALLLLVLCGCNVVRVNKEKIIVAQIGDETITKADFDKMFDEYLAYYGYTIDSTEIAGMLDTLKSEYLEMIVTDKVAELKIKELGFDKFTDEDYAAAEKDAQEWYDSYIDQFKTSYMANDSTMTEEQALAKAKEDLESYMTAQGVTMDSMKEQYLSDLKAKRLYDEATKDLEITDEEINTKYNSLVEDAKTKYENTPSQYYTDVQNGELIVYKPEGYYYIKHILIKYTQDILDKMSETTDQDELDKLRDEGCKGIQAKADEVLKKVKEGGDFEALIEEYGEDPGMKVEPSKTDGYLFRPNIGKYYSEFENAAALLTKDGDTSELVASESGYHILKRVSTVQTGVVLLSEVKDAVKDMLSEEKGGELYNEKLGEWMLAYNTAVYEYNL
ncbi:MAG: peptidylprolyl isomerase [Clostridia bacterium]|nr:peptidylprolyl isomerase [Clostridia bacterium]